MTPFTPKELTEQDVLALSAARDEPDWLRDRRQEAFKAFADLEWPHRKMEAWRMTDPRKFDLGRPAVLETGPAPAVPSSVVTAAGELAARATLSDGGLRDVEVGDSGVEIHDLSAAASGPRASVVKEHLGAAVGPEGKFEALSLAAFTTGALVYLPPELEVDRPISLTVHVDADGTHVPRILIAAGHHAHGAVYVTFTGDADATVIEALEVIVGDEARVDVVTAQQWGDRVDQIGTRRGRVERDGTYRQLDAQLGGKTAYIRPDVHLAGQGADGELLGVAFTDAGQHFETRSELRHDASNTHAEALYKGTLQGESRSVWYGNIRIEAHAKQCTSEETGRYLILTDHARADPLPFLEILTSDVQGCGHHSSVGQIDELQLFYLLSRGVPRREALRMLVFGFFSEVTDRIDLPGVTEAVLDEVAESIDEEAIVLSDPRRTH